MEPEKHESSHEKKEHTMHHTEHSHKKKKISKLQTWQIAAGVLGLLLIVSILTNGFGPGCEGVAVKLSEKEAAEKAINYLNANVLQGVSATVTGIDEQADLYAISLSIAGNEYDSYVTKDGRLLFPQGIALEDVGTASSVPSTPSEDYPKADKPKVDLFIMSYCPYGIQAQKGIHPVMELLGDKAEINIKWVPYIMHGRKEIDENTRQYCIQKEQTEKYVDYVGCFVESTDAEACGLTANIDEDMVAACMESANEEFNIDANYDDKSSWLSGRYPVYEVDQEEADALNVRGSPTMFINGKQYGGARTSEAYKAAICGAFNTAPEECDEVLSSASAAPAGSCG